MNRRWLSGYIAHALFWGAVSLLAWASMAAARVVFAPFFLALLLAGAVPGDAFYTLILPALMSAWLAAALWLWWRGKPALLFLIPHAIIAWVGGSVALITAINNGAYGV